MKFSLKDGRKFEVGGIKGVAIASIPCGSVAYSEVSGRHGKIKTIAEDRFYFVIEGHGKFFVGKDTLDVEKNDVIVIPKNTPYDFEGKMKLIMFFTPAYNPKFEAKLE